MDPQATVEAAVALAAPPKETEEQEEVKTIAELLGIDEIQPGERFEDFVEKVELATGVDVTEMETVSDKQVEEDKALGKVFYFYVFFTLNLYFTCYSALAFHTITLYT